MNDTRRAYIELHIAVFLFGFTAILGGLIQLTAIVLVWWRILITCSAIIGYGGIFKRIKTLPRDIVWKLLGIGLIVGLHWLTFFSAIKLSNASVALITFATTSFQSSLIEPFLTRQPIKWYEVMLGIVIVPAMAFVVGSLPPAMTLGVCVGLLSAFLAVIFSVLNKKMIKNADPLSITFLNLGGGWLLLTAIMPFYWLSNRDIRFMPQGWDWIYLFILALLCTNLGYMLAVRSLRHLSAFASNLTINLEPVYGIILAWLILKENTQLTPLFYVGASLIIVTVFSYPLIKSRFMVSEELK